MPTSDPLKNNELSNETMQFRRAVIVPLTESHRYLQSLGDENIKEAAKITAFANMLDTVVGDSRATDYIEANSNFGFADKQAKDIHKTFPIVPVDLAEIEAVFYDVIDAVQGLLKLLGDLFEKGKEELRSIIYLLSDFVNKMKRTLADTALKVYMHTKIEMIIRNQAAIRAA